MLLKQFRNKEDELRIQKEWISFKYANGHKEINVDNFLQMDYAYCVYTIEDIKYKGFFTKEEVAFIFRVLDYHKGNIHVLNG